MEKSSLTAMVTEHRALARDASSGRSAHTVYGGHANVLRQTVIALAAGQRLHEHENPGEATVHVLEGRVRLVSGEEACDAGEGDLVVAPQTRHSLEAVEPSVILLTVAMHG